MAYTTIDDPSAYFQAETYTGAGANTSVTFSGNSDLKPDFLWIKNRTAGYAPFVVDSNRNISYAQNSSNAPYLEPNDVSTENNNQNWMQSVNTDGFTTGISEHINNNSGSEYVAWAWKANGGTTSTNTDGVISSTVQVNSDAGFSILTYTMGSANQTVGHGLGVTPDVIIYKARFRGDANGYWVFYTTVLDGSLDYFRLHEDGYKFNSSLASPTSTTFVGAGSGTVSYRDFVAYCFAEKQGFSKFGKYIGNGNVNGPFIYTGFKPAWVLIKADSNYKYWNIFDNKRNPFNGVDKRLAPSQTSAEDTVSSIDFLSNGFKIRNSSTTLNESGTNIIYMAFAENPFVTSTGTPTTAG